MNAFAAYHPTVLLTYFLSVLVVSMFALHPVLQAAALLGGLVFCALLQSRRRTAADLAFYLPLFLLIAVTNPLFSHNGVTPLFFLNGNPVTLEALLYGVQIALMLVGVLFWCKCYSKVMTTDKFLYLFGRVIPKLALVLSMALRFLPLFLRRAREVRRAQKTLGLLAAKSRVDRIRGEMRVFLAVISWSLEHAMALSSAMKARGYGLKGRTQFSLFRFTPGDGVLLGVSLALFGLTLAGMATGATRFAYYPRLTAPPASPLGLLALCAFAVLCALPAILEGKEWLTWSFCKSKI